MLGRGDLGWAPWEWRSVSLHCWIMSARATAKRAQERWPPGAETQGDGPGLGWPEYSKYAAHQAQMPRCGRLASPVAFAGSVRAAGQRFCAPHLAEGRWGRKPHPMRQLKMICTRRLIERREWRGGFIRSESSRQGPLRPTLTNWQCDPQRERTGSPDKGDSSMTGWFYFMEALY